MLQELNQIVETDFTNSKIEKIVIEELTSKYGPVLSGSYLSQSLGYPSINAFRQALSRGTVPVPVFSLPNQRGKFALVVDVVRWLVKNRGNAINQKVINDNSLSKEGLCNKSKNISE